MDWILVFYFYIDIFKYDAELYITQFHILDGVFIKVPILFNSFIFTTSKRKYLIYKREFCAMVRFYIKYDYIFKNPSV